jgi:GntR family transcriptional repressor for pyruvate dehydrogenase complex
VPLSERTAFTEAAREGFRPRAPQTNPKPPKSALLLAQRIVRDMVRQQQGPGSVLAPERAMVEMYDVGRGTLREALRLLELQGVLMIRPGPSGGPVVLAPTSDHLASTLVLLMYVRNAPYRSTVEARLMLEPMICRLAGALISDETLERLAHTNREMERHIGSESQFLDNSRIFHSIIADASKNAVFAHLVGSLTGIMDGTVVGFDYPMARRTAVLRDHVIMLDALSARDGQASHDLMRDHLSAYSDYLEARYPEVLERIIPWERAFG